MQNSEELIRSLCDLQIPNERSIHISPDGKNVLYTTSLTWAAVKGDHGVSTLWIAKLNEANSARPITNGEHKDHSPAWHPLKNNEFAFISDRAGASSKSALYVTSLVNVEAAVAVTDTANEQAISKFSYSPDGELIAFISKDEKSEEQRRQEKAKEDVQVWGQGYKYSRLRILDVKTGKITTMSMEQHVLDFCWTETDSSGQAQIAFVTAKNDLLEEPYDNGTEVHLINVNLKSSRKLVFVHGGANDLCWKSSAGNGAGLYFRASSQLGKGFSGNALYKISIDDHDATFEKVDLGGEGEIVGMQTANKHVTGKVQNRLDDCVYSIPDKKLWQFQEEIEAYDAWFDPDSDCTKLVIAKSNVNDPVEIFSVSETGTIVQLSQHGKSFESRSFGACTMLSCPTPDMPELEIDAVFLKPPRGTHSEIAVTGPHPTVVLIHGGPGARVTNAFNTLYYMWTPYLLNLGYAILLPNYRGSTGRGQAFSSFSYDGASTRQYEDIITLTNFAVVKGLADRERLVVGGYSHGGLLTNLCAVLNGQHGHEWDFKAAISGAAICDFDTMMLTSDMGKVYAAALHGGSAPWNTSPEDTSTRRSSALWRLKQVTSTTRAARPTIPPILIIHGEKDERIPVSQAWGLRRALEYHNLPFEMAIYPRQGHVFHEYFFWIDMTLRIGRWIQQHIK